MASTSALKTGTTTDIASCWYNNLGTSSPSLILDVNVPSGSQTVAVYFLDYDKQGRSESVQMTDVSNNPLGLPIAVSGTNFANGEYLIWSITGEVHINITLVTGPNAVASGIFFGENSTMPPPVTSGSYQNITETIVGGGPYQQVNLLNVPAGTYLIHFSVSDAANITATQPLEGIGCILQPTNLIYSIGAVAVPYKGEAGMSVSAIDHLVTLVPTSITAACDSINSDKLQIESELEAIPVTSINVQTGGNTGAP